MSRIGIDVDGVLRAFCGDLAQIVKSEVQQYIKIQIILKLITRIQVLG